MWFFELENAENVVFLFSFYRKLKFVNQYDIPCYYVSLVSWWG